MSGLGADFRSRLYTWFTREPKALARKEKDKKPARPLGGTTDRNSETQATNLELVRHTAIETKQPLHLITVRHDGFEGPAFCWFYFQTLDFAKSVILVLFRIAGIGTAIYLLMRIGLSTFAKEIWRLMEMI